ncbi:hypothetical protein RU01_02115 [Rhodococcus sp. MEB064]|nr:hypothetical protein RU01_02115 [Rhodococcus sp. MEB064]
MIEESLADPWCIQHFTPWAASDPGTLIAEFFATISAAMKPKLRTKVRKSMAGILTVGSAAAEMIPVAGGAAAAAAKQAEDFLSRPEPFDKQFRRLSEDLRKAEVKILVVVDDIDRLHVDELMSLFKTIRLLGNFPGIHYLLAYDERTVCDVLASTPMANQSSERALKYLEKIVQYPFATPPLQPVHREREVASSLATVADRCGLDMNEWARENDAGRSSASDLLGLIPRSDLTTLRSIHRLCEQLEVALLSVGPSEVDFYDMLLITYIRLTHPTLHRAVFDSKSSLLGTGMTYALERAGRPQSEWQAEINRSTDGVSEGTQSELRNVLHYMFERVPRADHRIARQIGARYRPKRVSDATYFDRYFYLTVPLGDISDRDVIAGIEGIVQDGRLLSQSDLVAALSDERKALAAEKANRYLLNPESLRTASAGQFALASTALCERLIEEPEHSSPNYETTRMVGLLLLQAMSKSADTDGRQLLDDFESRFGPVRTAFVLSSSGVYPTDENREDRPPNSVWLENHRRRQYDACIDDLTGSTVDRSIGVLGLAQFLDFETRSRVSRQMLQMLDSGVELVELASRFVGSSERSGSRRPGDFYIDEFEQFVPRDRWTVSPMASLDIQQSDDFTEMKRKIAHFSLASESL